MCVSQAFAEELHEKVRKEYWGYDKSESLDAQDLHRIKYDVSMIQVTITDYGDRLWRLLIRNIVVL